MKRTVAIATLFAALAACSGSEAASETLVGVSEAPATEAPVETTTATSPMLSPIAQSACDALADTPAADVEGFMSGVLAGAEAAGYTELQLEARMMETCPSTMAAIADLLGGVDRPGTRDTFVADIADLGGTADGDCVDKVFVEYRDEDLEDLSNNVENETTEQLAEQLLECVDFS